MAFPSCCNEGNLEKIEQKCTGFSQSFLLAHNMTGAKINSVCACVCVCVCVCACVCVCVCVHVRACFKRERVGGWDSVCVPTCFSR